MKLDEVTLRKPTDECIAGRYILAVIKHCKHKDKKYIILKSVNEDNNCWRVADDNSELSWNWDVIAWDYLPELEEDK